MVDRNKIHAKFNGRCAYCGRIVLWKEMQIDHVIPQRNFEKTIIEREKIPSFLKHLTIHDVNHEDNLFPTCRVCNLWKKTFDLELFRNELTEQVNRLNKSSSNYRMAKMYGLVKETGLKVKFYFEK